MAYSAVTWSFKDLATSQKLQQMEENTATIKTYIEASNWLHLMNDFAEYSKTGDTLYTTESYGRIYIPANFTTLHFGVQLKTASGTGIATIRLVIDGTVSITASDANTTYQDKSGTVDITSLSAGWHNISIDLKTSNLGDTAYMKGLNIFIEPSAVV